MATKAKKTETGTKATKKVKVVPVERPEAVDPFAAPPADAKKKAPAGDNVHVAPTDDDELGDIAADIATFAKAKAAKKAAEAALEAASGNVMSYAKRVLLGLLSKSGSKPKGQKLAGADDAVVTTYYQDRTIKVDEEAYAMLCEMLGQKVVDADIVETSKTFTLNPEKVDDPKLFAKIREVLQAGLTAEELTGLFIPSGRTSKKGVVDMASKLCDGDTSRIDQLLQLVVPKPTLK